MYKTIKLSVLLLGVVLLLPSFVVKDAPGLKIPKKVDAIIQAKCFGCHNKDSKGQKAKDKIMFDELAGLPAAQQLEKLKGIEEVLAKGAMPPEKFLEKNPDKKLTDKETARMKKWAAKSVKKLSK